MWAAYDLGNEDFLWTAIPFMAGIGGNQNAPCGVIAAAAVCLALRHRCDLSDKPRAKKARSAIRYFAGKITAEFGQQYGAVDCQDLIRMDFSKPG